VRVVFFGTPECAVPYLDTIRQEHLLVAVVTQPDRPKGRGRILAAPSVKHRAEELVVPVLQPQKANEPEFIAELATLNADLFVVVAYGQILSRKLLELPKIAAVNVHYSLLPKLRGAAPVQHALMQGLTETGVTVQHIAQEVDAGDIILQQAVSIEPEDDSQSLTVRLTEVGIELLAEALGLLARGEAPRVPQDDAQATYAPLLTKASGEIDWGRPAADIVNLVRACGEWPGAWCDVQGRRVKLIRTSLAENVSVGAGEPGRIVEIDTDGDVLVATGWGALRLELVQPEGKRAMPATDYLRGARLGVGDSLGKSGHI